jgi:hypothetical protein
VTYCAVKYNNKMNTYSQNHARVHRSQNSHTVCEFGHVSGRAKVALLELSVCYVVQSVLHFSFLSFQVYVCVCV